MTWISTMPEFDPTEELLQGDTWEMDVGSPPLSQGGGGPSRRDAQAAHLMLVERCQYWLDEVRAYRLVAPTGFLAYLDLSSLVPFCAHVMRR